VRGRRVDSPVKNARFRSLRAKLTKLPRLGTRPGLWSAARHGVAAAVEHLDVPLNPATRTVLDVGASHGQFALLADHLFPEARIICFEPLPESRESIGEVLADRVEVVAAAVGATPGRDRINVSARDDSSSLLPIGDRQVKEFPGTGSSGSIEVPVTTLDESVPGVISRPCLLKVDVQGSELAVLQGAARTLEQVDEALIECSFVELYEGQPLADEIVAHMTAAGFRLRGVHGVTFSADGTAVQADFLFRRH
jgi:FkbM family methyltransferase